LAEHAPIDAGGGQMWIAIGGIIVFGGGLALYAPNGKLIGGLGLSGDTSCTDHVIAWKVRHQLRSMTSRWDLAPITTTT
jgi:uncharacterized protein GlcG (DUF336 family)